ncbi:MAG TPA: ribokinase [Candidatus Solibacter sp.]|nr:ribokinase [Candidatus Solibacter sp.]
MSGPRVAVVGSYATGLTMKVPRIPHAGETLLGTGYRVDFGGKGSNQAVGCARLGAQVDFVTKIGKDSFGEMALGLYRSERVNTSYVKQAADAPTGVGFIVVEESTGQNSIVLDPGANEMLSASDVKEAETVLASAAVVLTQLEIPVEAAETAMACGRAAGAVTILNPAPVRPLPARIMELIDILTPNETEARVLAGYAADVAIEPTQLGQELICRGVNQVVLTLGERGAMLISDSTCRHFPAVEVHAVDTTGAGDAFNAGLATALAHRADLEAAVEFAVTIGGMAVTKEGVIPSLPTRAEVVAWCRASKIKLPEWMAMHGKT